jgi:hypothetical protein
VAYHFHWPHDAILELEHDERRRWVKEISAINERRNSEKDYEAEHQTAFS